MKSNIRCENCGQPALETDTVCWHCGQPLAVKRAQATTESQLGAQPEPDPSLSAEPAAQVKERWQERPAAGDIAFYLGLTALVIFGVLLVMGRLGRYPLVRASIGERPLFEWDNISDAALTFALQLPRVWEHYDGQDPDQAAAFRQQLQQSELYRQGTLPLTSGVGDVQYLFLALSPRPNELPPAFLIVAKSATLSRLDYQEALQFLPDSEVAVREAFMVEDFDRQFLSSLVEIPVEAEGFENLRCRQQYIRGQPESLLMALCAPEPRYAFYEESFDAIYNSFQSLAS
jgi:hypothetical protein